MYDAIIVGARCAGSPTAMLLARRGYRVQLLDRDAFPSDHMSLIRMSWVDLTTFDHRLEHKCAASVAARVAYAREHRAERSNRYASPGPASLPHPLSHEQRVRMSPSNGIDQSSPRFAFSASC